MDHRVSPIPEDTLGLAVNLQTGLPLAVAVPGARALSCCRRAPAHAVARQGRAAPSAGNWPKGVELAACPPRPRIHSFVHLPTALPGRVGIWAVLLRPEAELLPPPPGSTLLGGGGTSSLTSRQQGIPLPLLPKLVIWCDGIAL